MVVLNNLITYSIISDSGDKSWMKRCELAEKFDIEKVDQSDFENTVGVLLMKWNYCLKNWMAHLSYAEWNYVTDLTEEHKRKVSSTLHIKRQIWFIL